MKKVIVIFSVVFGVLPLLSLGAQENPKIKKSELFVKEQGFSEAKKNVKKGDKLYKMGTIHYPDARGFYLKAAKYNPDHAELNYKIGVCYLLSDQKYEAIVYFKKAFQKKPAVTLDIDMMLGRAYHLVLDFDQARNHYEKALARVAPDDKPQIRRYIRECENGQEIMTQPKKVILTNLGNKVNSKYDDYLPIVNEEESLIYFNSRRPVGSKSERSDLDQMYFEDIYMANNIDDEWLKAMRVFAKETKDKNNKVNTTIVAVENNGSRVHYYDGAKNGGDIISLVKNKKGKYKSQKVLKNINSKYRETCISLSKDGKTAYFISTNPKTSRGGKDIYIIKKDSKGKWQKPSNLSPLVNTEFDEEGVFATFDSVSTLYFSSKGHNTMGGFDVFKTYIDSTGVWTEPENLGYPVNTADDDLFYRPLKGGKMAYYSTIRETGIGMRDIYKLVYLGEDKELLIEEEIVPLAGLIPPKPGIFFTVPEQQVIDNSILLKGLVFNAKDSTELLISKIEFIDLTSNTVVATSMSNEMGQYQVKLPEKKNYGVEVSANDFLLYLNVVDLMNNPSEDLILMDFGLEKVEIGQSIVLENIFFETGKATLKVESFSSLNDVAKLLEKNPKLKIEVSGHTDNVGSLKTNQKLSENRAKSVVDYLTGQGIQGSRMTYVGMGESQPLAPNNTPEGRAQNRRVEFKILSN